MSSFFVYLQFKHFKLFIIFFSLNSPNTPYILFYRRISTATSTVSSEASSNEQTLPSSEDKLPLFEDLPLFIRTFIMEDNEAYVRETKKFNKDYNKPLPKVNGWNDDDPPPSSCGNNFDVQQNRFIY